MVLNKDVEQGELLLFLLRIAFDDESIETIEVRNDFYDDENDFIHHQIYSVNCINKDGDSYRLSANIVNADLVEIDDSLKLILMALGCNSDEDMEDMLDGLYDKYKDE